MLAFTTMVGCGQRTPLETPTQDTTILRIGTTSSTQALAGNIQAAYLQVDTGTQLAFVSGSVAMLQHRLDAGEIDLFLSHILPQDDSVWAAPVTWDAITIVVNSSTALTTLSRVQLRQLFQGFVADWDVVLDGSAVTPPRSDGTTSRNDNSDTAGDASNSQQTVTLFSREDGATSRLNFEQLVMGNRRISPAARLLTSEQNIIEQVAQTPGALSYVTWTEWRAARQRQAVADGQVRVIAVDGVLPDDRSISSNQYPLRTTVYLVSRDEPQGTIRQFVGWLQSNDGQQAMHPAEADSTDTTPLSLTEFSSNTWLHKSAVMSAHTSEEVMFVDPVACRRREDAGIPL